MEDRTKKHFLHFTISPKTSINLMITHPATLVIRQQMTKMVNIFCTHHLPLPSSNRFLSILIAPFLPSTPLT